MTDLRAVSEHYGRAGLLEAILDGIERIGKTPETVTIEDLAAVDEFHVGGREATRSLLQRLDLRPEDDVLDIGCGIGGTARFAADTYGCRVTGIDLTEDYTAVGNTLCAYVGCASHVQLETGDATNTGYDAGRFDKVFMLHVGMNIKRKADLAREVYRLLKPEGVFGIYDLMRVGKGDPQFPVPWATTPDTSAIESPAFYRDQLEDAGFDVFHECNRREFALDFARRLQARMQHSDGPPPLGLHLLMGPTAPKKYRNMVAGIAANIVAPVEILARKSG